MTIYKYQLEIMDEQVLSLHKGFRILTVDVQNDVPTIWVLSEPANEMVEITFKIRVTGLSFYLDLEKYVEKYIGTFQLLNSHFVGHLFYKE